MISEEENNKRGRDWNSIGGTEPPTSFGGSVPQSGFDAWLETAKKPAASTAPTTAEPQGKPAATVEPAKQPKQYNSYEDVMKMVEGHIESEAERRARERREKSRAMVNSIADMGRAIANLYYTGKGAPNAYSQENSLSEAYQKKLDKAKAERDKNRDWWVNWALTQAKLKQTDESNRLAAENTAWTREQTERTYKDSRSDKERELTIKEKEQQEKSQARAELNYARIKQMEAKQAGDAKKAEYWEAKESEAQAKEVGEYTRAAYWKAKADEIRNGTTTTTSKTVDDPIKGKTTTTQTVTKKPDKSVGWGGKSVGW